MSSVTSSVFARKRTECELKFQRKKLELCSKYDDLQILIEDLKEEENSLNDKLKDAQGDSAVDLQNKIRDLRADRRVKEKDAKQILGLVELIPNELKLDIQKVDEEEEAFQMLNIGRSAREPLRNLQRATENEGNNETPQVMVEPQATVGVTDIHHDKSLEVTSEIQNGDAIGEQQNARCEPSTPNRRTEMSRENTGGYIESWVESTRGVRNAYESEGDRTDRMIDVMTELLQEQRKGNTSSFVTRQVAGKDLPRFDGNCMEWPAFKAQFDQTTAACRFTDVENLYRLQKSLVGKAKEVVQAFLTTPSNVKVIMKTLEKQFGRPQYIIQSLIKRVRESPNLRDGKSEHLITFSNATQNLVVTIENLRRKEYLINPQLLEELVGKMDHMYRLMWGQEVMRRGLLSPTLRDFSDWLETLSDAAQWVTPPQEFLKERKVFVSSPEKDKNAKTSCRYCKEVGHFVRACKKFKSQPITERIKWVQDSKLCFSCLGPNHSVKTCRQKRECGINGCHSFHNRAIHQDRKLEVPEELAKDVRIGVKEKPQLDEMINARFHQFHLSKYDDTQCLLRIVPVVIRGPMGEIKTHAMFDEGAQCTLMEQDLADELGISGKLEPLKLTWTNGKSNYHKDSQQIEVTIGNVENGSSYIMPCVRTVQSLDLPRQTINMEQFRTKYPYLRRVPVAELDDVQPKLLIGEDNIHLTIPREVVDSGNPDEPLASRSKLGWAVHGNAVWQKTITKKFSFHMSVSCDEDLHQLVKETFRVESIGVKIPEKKLQSKDDERAYQLMESTTKKTDDGRWETGLLWKSENVTLPSSYNLALKRLHTMEKQLDKDKEMAEWYYQKMNYYQEVGYLKKVSHEDLSKISCVEWYIPHFAASNPNKPGKLRMVFDAAAKVGGTSLNENLLTGPDLLNSLPGVLMRFRRFPVAIAGDVKEMFQQIKIRDDDRPAQRCLWRGANRVGSPDVYQMDVMIFGAACSPSSSQFVMRKNADCWNDKYPEAVATIKRNIYMDDCLQSEVTEEEAAERIRQINEIQSSGGMEMLKWMSNSLNVMSSVSIERRAPSMLSLDVDNESTIERVLGMYWNAAKDCVTYQLKFPRVEKEILEGKMTPTKRQALKLVASLFDPLGAVAFFTVRMRILLQDVWRSGIDWDDKLEDGMLRRWNAWLKELQEVTKIRIPRCYSKGISKCDKIDLHVFTDASSQAYSSCAYLCKMTNGEVDVSFVYGKARVAPLNPLSIPRLELCGSVLGVRMAAFIREELDLDLDKIYNWTDSRTVLCWIRSDARKYKQFVAHRIGEILELSDVNQWGWVPTNENPADAATRETEGNLISDNMWITGPAFLKLEEEHWPKEPVIFIGKDDEVRSKAICVINKIEDVINMERFSSYLRLVRTTARVLRAGRISKPVQWSLDVTEQEKAEACLWKLSQAESFHSEIELLRKGKPLSACRSIIKLSPFLDEKGVLRVGTRAERASLDVVAKYPIIISGKSHLAALIVKKYHYEAKHKNKEAVLNELRQKFWITGARSLLKKIIWSCCICKIWTAKPSQPRMGLLPEERLDFGCRPFTNCGVDLFGPLTVMVRRSTEKRYGIIFTCLTTRAIHLEIVDSLSTDSTIMAIKRMISIRGKMKTILSDNGTNFRGAATELANEMKKVNFEMMKDRMGDIGVNWRFIPPSSPHMGGCWERLIRSVKGAMYAALEERGCKEKSPTDEVLRTVFAEAVGLVNSRPLTVVSDDSSDDEALTPNHFLLGTSGLENPFQYLEDNEDLKKKWKQVQRIRDVFWNRWRKEYLPSLAERKKWNRNSEPVKIGDLVFLAESNMPRGHWMRGRVVAVYPGKDGVIRVVDVRTPNGLLRRPVVKCAVLDVI